MYRGGARSLVPLHWRCAYAWVAAAWFGVACAAESPLELEEVVVTGQRGGASLGTLPQSISVITEREIRRSTASTVTELLRQEANLNLQSFFSNDKFATVDVRGMGATANSNVIVLVDGVRLNADDLAGPDYSTLPLSRIERVEIVRGGSGVRHGDGAVGGVINLITKSAGREQTSLSLLARRGSHDTDDFRLHGTVSRGPLSLGIDFSDFDTDGYRHNDFLEKRDGAITMRVDGFEILSLTLNAARHEDRYGLPGPVGHADLHRSTFARRQTRAPFDRGSTKEDRYGVAFTLDTERFGKLAARAAYRARENPYFIGFNPIASAEDQRNRIDTAGHTVDLEYEYALNTGPYAHSLELGADLNDARYLRQENGTAVPGSSTRRRGSVQDRGYFGQLTLEGPFGLTLSGGYRRNRFASAQSDRSLLRRCDVELITQTVLVETPFGPLPVPLQIPVERNCAVSFDLQARRGGTAHDEAFNLGLTWRATDWLTVFASGNGNFRNPNVDEFLFATEDLRGQKGIGIDVGLRFAALSRIELAATVFALDIEDEIFFSEDALGRARNRNLDRMTKRRGGELEIRMRPFESLSVHANVGYVRPRADGADADIPLVPRITANVGAEWTMTQWSELAVSATHVGSRFDGNDIANDAYPKLPPYTTCDVRARARWKQAEFFVGINNVFNEIYSTIAYSATVYPMPERSAYAGVRLDLL